MRSGLKMVALAMIALALSSCIPESENPLSDPKKAEYDERLTGVWTARFPEEKRHMWIHFVEAKNSMTDVVIVFPKEDKEKGADVLFYTMHPTVVGKYEYMNLKPDLPKEYRSPKLAKKIESAGYIFVRYAISNEGVLRIWFFGGTPVKQAIQDGRLKGNVAKSTDGITEQIRITDNSENIRDFLKSEDTADVFELLLVCHKMERPH